jgi:hypothetical protein
VQIICKYIKIFKFFLNSIYLFLKIFLGFTEDVTDIAKMIVLINKLQKSFLYKYYEYTKWIFLMTKFKDILPKPVYVTVYFEPPT